MTAEDPLRYKKNAKDYLWYAKDESPRVRTLSANDRFGQPRAVDPWLNEIPAVEDQERWVRARDEYAAHDENERLDQIKSYEISDKVRLTARRIGNEWYSALMLRLEAGHDPVDAFQRVLTGTQLDDEWYVAIRATPGYDGIDGWYENVNDRYPGASDLTVSLTHISDGLDRVEDVLARQFVSHMSQKGPKDSKGNRREPWGSETIRTTWAQIVDQAEVETLAASEPVRFDADGSLLPVALTDPAKVRSFDLEGLAAMPVYPPLIEGLVDAESVTLLLGQFGTYKTFALVGWALAVASGTPWCGHKVSGPAPVLYVAAEGITRIRERFLAYRVAHGMTGAQANLHFYAQPLQLGDEDSVAELIAEGQRLGAKLVIVDTLHRVTTGLDTMGDGGAGIATGALDRIRAATGASIVVAHHTGYAGEHARGSSALEDDADSVWLIQKKGGSRTQEPAREMSQRKNRDGATAATRKLEFHALGRSGYVTVEPLDETLSVEEIVEALDDADLTNTASERLSRDALTGTKYSRADLREAIAIRKEREA